MSARTGVLLLVSITCFFLEPNEARGDGAFPDSMGILLPADQPNRIIASTNFGLLTSEDDGATWDWICEQAIGVDTYLYQQGAPPDDLLVAISLDGLTYSRDFGCTWQRPSGSFADQYPYDAFPDPTSPPHVFALARLGSTDGGINPQMLRESVDGARTFGSPLFSSSGTQYLSGVENARTNPQTVYLTLYDLIPVHPYIARSYDGGSSGTWQTFDLGQTLGARAILLIAVDPVNANRLYLRLGGSTGIDALGISDDSGATVRVAYELTERMTAFLRRSDGALIIATASAAFISTDGGATFAPWPNAPHLRALGERNGVLYAVANNFVDGYAVGRSRDRGVTWEGLIRFERLRGIKRCGNLEITCAGPWQTLQSRLMSGADGGTADGGGGLPQHSGCCSQGAGREGSPWNGSGVVLALLAAGLLAIRQKLRQRGGRR